MRKNLSIIFLIGLFLGISSTTSLASTGNIYGLEEHNLTLYEANLIKEFSEKQPLPQFNQDELNKNIAKGQQQKKEATQEFIKKAIENTINGEVEENLNSYSPQTTWYLQGFSTLDNAHGGSGLGTSDSYWASDYRNRNGSLVGINGYRWANGWGYTTFTPPSTGTYNVTSNFNITGNIWGGVLEVNVKFIDTNDNTELEQTFLRKTSGYSDNQSYNVTKSFYLKGGHSYIVVFEVATEAQAIIGAEMADFLNTETDGTQRNVDFEYLRIVN